MAPILANFGVADPLKLRLVLSAWEQLFDAFRPDLIVADYSPGATLAARGRIPVVQCSESFTLPPDDLEHFPVLLTGLGPEVDQSVMLDAINSVLAETGRQRLARLPEIFSGVAQIVHTFPALDIYADRRAVAAVGPFAGPIEASHGRGSGRIFAYLSSKAGRTAAVADLLRPHAPSLAIFAPGARGSPALADLAAHGATIQEELRPLAERLADTALFVNYGSSAVIAESLAAGVPQLALVHDLEKLLNGHRLERAGVGRAFKIMGNQVEGTAAGIGAMLEDPALADRAADQGERHRALLKHDPLAAFERACLRALSLA